MTDAPADPTAPPAPRRRRRAWPFVVIAIVLVVLIVGFFVADAAAKAYARDRIRSELVSSLGLADTAQVGVDLGPGSILLQALSGRVDTVDVTVPKLAFGELVGAADIRATQVPLDTSKPVRTLSVTYTVTEADVAALAKHLSGVDVGSVSLTGSQIVAKATLSVFGTSVPVTVGLMPSASGGRITFTPTTVGVAGHTYTAAELVANPFFSGLATSLLGKGSFCVAQYLPKALTATSVKVVGKTLVLSFSGDGTALGSSAFRTKGTCS